MEYYIFSVCNCDAVMMSFNNATEQEYNLPLIAFLSEEVSIALLILSREGVGEKYHQKSIKAN